MKWIKPAEYKNAFWIEGVFIWLRWLRDRYAFSSVFEWGMLAAAAIQTQQRDCGESCWFVLECVCFAVEYALIRQKGSDQ